MDRRFQPWRVKNALAVVAEARDAGPYGKARGKCVIADFARGAFQKAQLIAEQNEPLRLIEDSQGEFGIAENARDGSTGPLDFVGDRPDGAGLGEFRRFPS